MVKTNESILCAGFGGQGIMLLGKVLATAGMAAGYEVTWLPAYGAEVRGGTAHSMVKISSCPIGSPVVFPAGTAIIMNEPSLDKFERAVAGGGLIILNTSMVERAVSRRDVEVAECRLTEEAISLGSKKVANMIAAGIFMARKGIISRKIMAKVIEDMAGGRKDLIDINIKALDRGMELGKSKK